MTSLRCQAASVILAFISPQSISVFRLNQVKLKAMAFALLHYCLRSAPCLAKAVRVVCTHTDWDRCLQPVHCVKPVQLHYRSLPLIWATQPRSNMSATSETVCSSVALGCSVSSDECSVGHAFGLTQDHNACQHHAGQAALLAVVSTFSLAESCYCT